MLWKNCSVNSGIVTGLLEKELLGTCKQGHGTGSHLHKVNFTVIMRVMPLLSMNCAGVKKTNAQRWPWNMSKGERFKIRTVVVARCSYTVVNKSHSKYECNSRSDFQRNMLFCNPIWGEETSQSSLYIIRYNFRVTKFWTKKIAK